MPINFQKHIYTLVIRTPRNYINASHHGRGRRTLGRYSESLSFSFVSSPRRRDMKSLDLIFTLTTGTPAWRATQSLRLFSHQSRPFCPSWAVSGPQDEGSSFPAFMSATVSCNLTPLWALLKESFILSCVKCKSLGLQIYSSAIVKVTAFSVHETANLRLI